MQEMSDPMEVLSFMDEKNDSDLRTFEVSLRSLAKLSKGSLEKMHCFA